MIRVEKSEADWSYHFKGWSAGSHGKREWMVIEPSAGPPVGFLCYHDDPDSGGFGVHRLELVEGAGYFQVMSDLKRALWNLASRENGGKPPGSVKLRLSFFRPGLEISIINGGIAGIESWLADSFWHAPSFPDLSFLQLVFGRRRCAELKDIYVDCEVDPESAAVLDSLFPPFKGTVWPGN